MAITRNCTKNENLYIGITIVFIYRLPIHQNFDFENTPLWVSGAPKGVGHQSHGSMACDILNDSVQYHKCLINSYLRGIT